MLNDITIGQYVGGNSLIHKMDARVKIILTLLFCILIFSSSNIVSCFLVIGFIIAVIAASKIPPRYILKGIKPILFIILFTVFINLFLTPGDIIWQTPKILGISLKITLQGVKMSLIMFFRLTLLVCTTSLLTLTTKPLMLTDGIESLLKPLKIIKVPAHEIAMMMSIAIRFIPTLAEETDKIIKAQKARGADFESGNLIKRAKAMIPLLIPLFISAFKRADELATAMDSRCYHGGENRTRMKEMKMGRIDYIAIIVVILFSVVLLLCEMFV